MGLGMGGMMRPRSVQSWAALGLVREHTGRRVTADCGFGQERGDVELGEVVHL